MKVGRTVLWDVNLNHAHYMLVLEYELFFMRCITRLRARAGLFNKAKKKTESAWLNLLLFPVNLTFPRNMSRIVHKNECEGIGEVDERS